MNSKSVAKVLAVSALASIAIVEAKEKNSTPEVHSLRVLKPATMPKANGPSEYFTGSAEITLLAQGEEPSNLASASVTFQPNARTAWHTHPKGQLLVVTEGAGLIQEHGKPIQKIKSGDIVWTPPGVKHWHGASTDSSMTHIAVHESSNGVPVKWMEKVSDREYGAVAK